MGLIYASSDANEAIQVTRANLNAVREMVNRLNQATQKLLNTIGTKGMSGQAYQSGGDLVEELVPPALAELNTIVDRMEGDLRSLIAADQQVNHYGYLDEDHLENLLSLTDSKLSLMHQLQSELNQIGQGAILDGMIASTENQKRQYQQMLDDLRTYNANTAHLFSNITSGTIKLKALVGGLSSSTSANSELKLTEIPFISAKDLINETILNEKLKKMVDKILPKGSLSDKQNLIAILKAEVKELGQDGWDNAAISDYLSYLNRHTLKDAKADQVTAQQKISSYWRSVHNVGSKIYNHVYAASKLKAHDKLDLVINKQLGGYVDQNGFLQLPANSKYHLKDQLSPLNSFYPMIRDSVVKAYGKQKTGLKADDLGQKVHLFRSYLDRSYLNYIHNYDGVKHNLSTNATDYQRLQQFNRDHHLKADYSTGANLHNRQQGQFTYPENMKVQLMKDSTAKTNNDGRMIEFIVNMDNGNFVSEWNAYNNHLNSDGTINSDPDVYSKQELQMIANTESFNYGIPSGGQGNHVPEKYKGTHNNLDRVHPADPQLRQQATQKGNFVSEKDYTENGGKYADIVKQGNKDIQAWSKVPDNQKQQAYQEYVNWLKKHGNVSNQGFDYYMHASKN